MRDSVLFYRNQLDALLALPPDMLKESLLVIARYAMDDIEPEGQGIGVAMLNMCRPLIDANNKKAKNKTELPDTSGNKPGTSRNKPGTSGNIPEQTEDIPEQTGYIPEQTGTKGEINKGETSKGETSKGETSKERDILSGKPAAEYPYKAIIDYLNAKTGKRFEDKSKDTRSHIRARINEGFTLQDFYKVIDTMVAKWGSDPKMCDYLRPATLFGPKFESYLNSKPPEPPKVTNKFNNFPQRDYDWDSLEAALLKAQ